MHLSSGLWAFALAASSFAQAQLTQHADLSFSDNTRSSNGYEVQNYDIIGDPFPPAILSNKIILTPPAPGNVRAGVWSKKSLWNPRWSAALEFRAAGPDRASGRLQLWLTKNGKDVVGTSSIYSVGRWEGLSIVIDQYAGSGGMVRGFLNDGKKDYKREASVDGLAFGHCAYAYRNLGRPSLVQVEQSDTLFKVTVDGKTCFETPAVRIPLGYNFGLTATSAENPDSFEVFKLSVATDKNKAQAEQTFQDYTNKRQEDTQAKGIPQRINPNTNYLSGDRIPKAGDIPDVAASEIDTTKQFADLHYRLQSLMKHLAVFQGDFQGYQVSANAEHKKLVELLTGITQHTKGKEFPYGQMDAMDKRLQVIESTVLEIKRDLKSHNAKLVPQLDAIRRTVRDSHGNIMEGVDRQLGGLASSVPKIGVIILVVFGSQAFLVAAFLWYKRRKAMGPKKYL